MIEVREDLPKFVAMMVIRAPGMDPITYTFEDLPPKEVMDEYQQLLGDCHARVTVSADMSLKDFGNGVSSMCTVSLTCNQDGNTIQRALGLAGHIARWYTKENRKLADDELKAVVAQQQAALPNNGTYR